jgi:AcrR family transcriptional regulator
MSVENPEPELPRAVALAWGVAANPQRGPKREMSIERIVDAAVSIADDGGIAAVSMAAVASSLGFTPMSLYRYVTSKDDLTLLMQEAGIGVPPETVLEAIPQGWRTALEVWVDAMAVVYQEHPWLLDIAIETTPTTPNNLAWLDTALEVMASLPLSDGDKVSIVLALIAQVRWQAHIYRGYDEAATRAGTDADALDWKAVAALEVLVTEAEFPRVHAALHAGVFSPEGGGDPFAVGRALVLDGVEALLAGKKAAPLPVRDPLDAAAASEPKVREAARLRREAEKMLREARKRERDVTKSARERLARQK